MIYFLVIKFNHQNIDNNIYLYIDYIFLSVHVIECGMILLIADFGYR